MVSSFQDCVATVLGTNNSQACQFPFAFNGKTHKECTFDYNELLNEIPQPWCSLNRGQTVILINEIGYNGSKHNVRWQHVFLTTIELG